MTQTPPNERRRQKEITGATPVTETDAKEERKEMRKALDDTEAPTRAEIHKDDPGRTASPEEPPAERSRVSDRGRPAEERREEASPRREAEPGRADRERP
jgi:hypothetical protein